jgi:hypothetical protein
MIAGEHKAMAVAVVMMPDGSQRLQIIDNSGKWSHIVLAGGAAYAIREHLGLPVIATPPVYQGTQEPVRGFA